MKRKKEDDLHVGIAWYRPEQWDLLLMLAEDRENLEDTHAAWLAQATKTLQELKSQGVKVEPVEIDIHRFMVWCQSRGLRNNGEARTQYVSAMIQEKVEGKSTGKKS